MSVTYTGCSEKKVLFFVKFKEKQKLFLAQPVKVSHICNSNLTTNYVCKSLNGWKVLQYLSFIATL